VISASDPLICVASKSTCANKVAETTIETVKATQKCMRTTQIAQPVAGDMLTCVLPWMSSMAGGLSSGGVSLTKATQFVIVRKANQCSD
jgi:hypothetical protein